mgnify:CR=1 FL=1
MLKRILTLTLALAFVTTASASSVGPAAVQSVLKEFSYSTSVEWDQKDPAFYKAQVEKLKSDIVGLQAQGMSMSEIISAAAGAVKDAQLAADMKAAMEVVEAGKMNMEDAQQVILQAAKNSSAQGASWSGDAFMFVGPIIGLVLVIALLSGSSSDNSDSPDGGGGYDGGSDGPTYQCGYNWVSYWGYDSFGSYRYMSDYVWTCGWY